MYSGDLVFRSRSFYVPIIWTRIQSLKSINQEYLLNFSSNQPHICTKGELSLVPSSVDPLTEQTASTRASSNKLVCHVWRGVLSLGQEGFWRTKTRLCAPSSPFLNLQSVSFFLSPAEKNHKPITDIAHHQILNRPLSLFIGSVSRVICFMKEINTTWLHIHIYIDINCYNVVVHRYTLTSVLKVQHF